MIQRSVTSGTVTTTESFLYTYNGSGWWSNAKLRRQTNGGECLLLTAGDNHRQRHPGGRSDPPGFDRQ